MLAILAVLASLEVTLMELLSGPNVTRLVLPVLEHHLKTANRAPLGFICTQARVNVWRLLLGTFKTLLITR